MQTEDGSIIYECLSGDSDAFGILVDKYKAGIYAYTYGKLGNFQDAQDVTQEVFEHAYRGLSGLRRWERFAFWLYRIAANRCKMWIRYHSRRPDNQYLEDQDTRMLDAPSLNSYHEKQVDKSLWEFLDSLPEIYRETLMLYYFGGLTCKDIAKAIGASPSAVRMRLTRARAQLRKEMVAMMDMAFEGQQLQANFTFRVMEVVRNIRINPIPRVTGISWGLSLAVGIFIAIIGLNPEISPTSDLIVPSGLPLHAEIKIQEIGDIPVDILKTSEMAILSSNQENIDDRKPNTTNSQKATFLAPRDQGDTWAKKGSMAVARGALRTSVVDGKLYAIGGSAAGWGAVPPLKTTEEYDPVTDEWMKKADMPTGRWKLSTSVMDGLIYAIGGYGQGTVYSVVEIYDPKTDKWTKGTPLPTVRAAHTASVVNGKIYVIGGAAWSVGITSVVEYDPVTDVWTEKADMPTARGSMCAEVINGKIYVIGGWFDGARVADVEVYDPATDTWEKLPDMSVARSITCSSVINNKIYIIGGDPDCAKVEEYDPMTGEWTEKNRILTGRYNPGASVLNGHIYVVGGNTFNGQMLSVVEEYDTGFVPESVEPEGKLPTKWGQLKSE